MKNELRNAPAFRLAALLIVGIVVGRITDIGVDFLYPAAIAGFILSCSLLLLGKRSSIFNPLLVSSLVLLCIIAGAVKSSMDAKSSFSFPDSLQRKPTLISGTIKVPPSTAGEFSRFVMEGEHVVHGSSTMRFPATVFVTVKQSRKDTSVTGLEYGMNVALRGTLSRPSAERNPGEFSAKQYYEANGIELLMNVRGYSNVSVLDDRGGTWLMRSIVVPVRTYILDLLSSTNPGEEGEFLKGILIGERSGISPATRQSFTNSGVAHVLAVSGSNVAVVAAVLFVLLDFLRLRKWMRIVLTCAGLVFYMLLTGSQPPVVRATIMALVFLLAGLAQEKSNAYNALGLSALIILALDARQVFDVGFQLSFVAVLSMMYFYPKADTWIRLIQGTSWWRSGIVWTLRVCAVSAIATLGTLPLTAVYFGRVSVIGILANIIVIPAVGLSVVLGVASLVAGVVSLWVAEVYAALNQVVLQFTIFIAQISGGLSFAYVDTLRFTVVDALPFYAALMLAFHLSSGLMARRLVILLLITLNVAVWLPMPAAYAAPAEKLRVSFIDVGQGDAALVEFPDGRTMLVDAGPKSRTYDAGERTVVPFLKRRGISTIDLLVVSHPHSDHIGGVSRALQQLDVKRVIDSGQPVRSEVYRDYLVDISNEMCVFESGRAGRLIEDYDPARLYVVYPTPTYIDTDTSQSHPNLNNTSVVFKLCYGNVSFLFAGDAEEEAESEMVKIYGGFLRSTMLKAGHHGSITSSTQEFLDSVKPSHVVVSVGRNNKFRHPSPVVLDRFTAMGASVARTDEDGAIIFETDGLTLSQIEWR